MANTFKKAGLLLAALTLGSAGAFAADSGKSQVSASDRKFMEKAAEGGMAEVELGSLAQQKASNAQVKEFGAKMVQDHGKAGEDLKQLASSKGVTLPTAVDSHHKKDADKLAKLSGDKFDREYMEHMVKDHKKDVKEFQKASKDAKDPDLKAFAAKTLSVIEGHLQLADRTENAVKGKPDAGSPEKTSRMKTSSAADATVSGNTANISGNAPASGAARKPTSTQAGTASR